MVAVRVVKYSASLYFPETVLSLHVAPGAFSLRYDIARREITCPALEPCGDSDGEKEIDSPLFQRSFPYRSLIAAMYIGE